MTNRQLTQDEEDLAAEFPEYHPEDDDQLDLVVPYSPEEQIIADKTIEEVDGDFDTWLQDLINSYKVK